MTGSTLSPRRLAGVAAVLAALLLAVVVVAARAPGTGGETGMSGDDVPRRAAAVPAVPAGDPAAEPDEPEPSPEPSTDAEPEPEPPDEPTLREEAAAHQVATDFAANYAEYHFDDPPTAPLDRVRPFVTEELAAELGRNSGAAVGRAELQERQERAVGTVQAIQRQSGGVDEGRIDLLVVVRQDVTWPGGSLIRWPSYVVQVVRTEEGWRVARVLL